jgi:hypothetical protein
MLSDTESSIACVNAFSQLLAEGTVSFSRRTLLYEIGFFTTVLNT